MAATQHCPSAHPWNSQQHMPPQYCVRKKFTAFYRDIDTNFVVGQG